MAENSYIRYASRAEARAAGEAQFHSGVPCPRGHIAARKTASGECTLCCAERKRERRAADPERSRAEARLQREKCREQNMARMRAYHASPQGREARRQWLARNKARVRALRLANYAANREKYRAKVKAWAEANPKSFLETRKRSYAKRRSRPAVRISDAVSRAVSRGIKGGKAGGKTWDILPYKLDALMKHLESQFTEGMTWDNYGDWHVDHIVPLSVFNFSSVDHIDFQRAWAITNLQPLWAKDNRIKSGSISRPFQPSLAM